MAIDISTDLIIQADGQILSTPTTNGVYDAGGAPGQYNPGKDYSATDNVSRGLTATYEINISLNSKTNQEYPLDKLTLASADVNGNLTYVKLYFLNDNPDALDTQDTGVNTLAGEAAVTPVVLNQNIRSNSTLTTNLIFALPGTASWKTKIEPKIIIIAEKDGKQATFITTLPIVKMAPKANYVSVISPPLPFENFVSFHANAFRVPFIVTSDVQQISNVTLLANRPDFAAVTYQIDLTAKVNNTLVPLAPLGFTFSPPAGFTVTNYTYTGTVLTVTLSGPFKSFTPFSFTGYASVPFVPPTGATNASLRLTGAWAAESPVAVQANNNYQILFNLPSVGWIDHTAPFVDLTDGGVGALRLRHVIATGGLYDLTTSQTVASTHDTNLVKYPASKYIFMLDSPVAGLKPAASPVVQLQFTDMAGTERTVFLPDTAYTQSFSYASAMQNSSYNPNTIAQQILSGAIPSGSYQDILNTGHKPNARILLFNIDIWSGTDYNPLLEHRVFCKDIVIDPMDSTEFMDFYTNNPSISTTSFLYSYVSLNTPLSSVEEGNTLYGGLMAPMDNFEKRNNRIFLNLGTTQKGGETSVLQFNDTSVVQLYFDIPHWFSDMEYGIVDANNAAINPIGDYTKQYYLMLRRKTQPVHYWNAPPIIEEGTPLEFNLPASLAPYFVVTGTPFVRDINNLVTPITGYQYNGSSIKFNWPVEMSLQGYAGAYFPIRFIVPSVNLPVTFTNPIIPPENILLDRPDSIVNRFPSNTPYYDVEYFLLPTQLIGLEIDTTGLYVAPNIYPNGTSVKYTAIVYNDSFASSDYYTIQTVPTNQYNEIETSNNNQKAYINAITTFQPDVEVYYQIESKVTEQDITAAKTLGQPPLLEEYYHSVILPTWTKWINGAPLPSGVVMFASFTPDVAKGIFTRVDYDVTVQMDVNTTELYINNASFKYQSTGSGLEAHSNVVSIRNMPRERPEEPIKTANPETLDSLLHTNTAFTIVYNLPNEVNTSPQTVIDFTDSINPLLLVTSSTLNLPASQFYTITNLSSGNTVHYRMKTHIPDGQTGNIPTTLSLTIHARYNGPKICEKIIANIGQISIDGAPPLSSKPVYVKINTPQSIIDMAESIALMQTAISHILNAEGEKIQAIISHSHTVPQYMLKVNNSAKSLINSITLLESALHAKLEYFSCNGCMNK